MSVDFYEGNPEPRVVVFDRALGAGKTESNGAVVADADGVVNVLSVAGELGAVVAVLVVVKLLTLAHVGLRGGERLEPPPPATGDPGVSGPGA